MNLIFYLSDNWDRAWGKTKGDTKQREETSKNYSLSSLFHHRTTSLDKGSLYLCFYANIFSGINGLRKNLCRKAVDLVSPLNTRFCHRNFIMLKSSKELPVSMKPRSPGEQPSDFILLQLLRMRLAKCKEEQNR